MALGLLEAGHRVLIVDRDEGQISSTLAIARDRGLEAMMRGHCVDLTDEDAASRILREILGLWGGVDVLVNNAGLGPSLIAKDYFQNPPSFADLSDQAVRLFFDVNAITPFLLCIRCARKMRSQSWGRIVNVTTSLDSMVRRGFAPYGGTKASLEAHSATMAHDLEGSGVTVNVLIPGGAANTQMIPDEAGFDRRLLVPPYALVAPLLWIVQDSDDAPNGKRILAAPFAESGGPSDRSVFPVGWDGPATTAVMP